MEEMELEYARTSTFEIGQTNFQDLTHPLYEATGV